MKVSKLRVSGETFALLTAFILLIIASLFILQIGIWLLIVLIISQLIYIQIVKRQMYGNSLLVSETQFRDMYSEVFAFIYLFQMQVPLVFIQQDPYMNAYSFGFEKPFSIVLSSALVEGLTTNELSFVLAHEMAHIKLSHTKWLSFISPLGRNNPILSLIYAHWQRKSEYSADRVAYYFVSNLKCSINTLIKITIGTTLSQRVDYSELINQISQGEKQKFANFGEIMMTHPYVLNRIEELIIFKEKELVNTP